MHFIPLFTLTATGFGLLAALAASSSPAHGQSFLLRPVPGALDAPAASATAFTADAPSAANFFGNGRLQWYAGGSKVTAYPDAGSMTLPSLTLPQWTPSVALPVAGLPVDVNHDGLADIVRVNAWSGMSGYYTLATFINAGNGTFVNTWRLDWQNDPPFAHGAIHHRLAVADFDGDGDSDLAMLTLYEHANGTTDPPRQEGSLSIRWNAGEGQFTSATTLQSNGFDMAARLGAADLDHDGDQDLVVREYRIMAGNGLWQVKSKFYYNNGGSGSFTAVTKTGVWPTQAVDFNHDGWPDLVSSSEVALNDRSGLTSALDEGYPWAVGADGGACAFGDFDGDGLPDRVQGDSSALHFRRGDGTSTLGPKILLGTVPSQVTSLTAADADADGDVDVLAGLGSGGFVFLENTMPHALAGAAGPDPAETGVISQNGLSQVLVGDFDRDGRDDLVSVVPSDKKMWFHRGLAGGTWAPPVFRNTQNAAPGGAALVDLDRDGWLDVAYTLPSAGQVRLASNGGAGFFAWTDTAVATGLPGVSLVQPGQLGSANGRTELLVSSGTTGQLRWLYQQGNTWLGQNVLSSDPLPPKVLLPVNATYRPGDEAFHLGSNGSSFTLRGHQLNPTWVGAGDLTQAISTPAHTPAADWGDVTGDGSPEFVLVAGAGNIGWWKPSGGSSLTYGIGMPTSPVRALKLVDWDRDGRQDVLCGTDEGLTLFVAKNGAWTQTTLLESTGGFDGLELIDLDHDAFPDVIAINRQFGRIVPVRNAPRLAELTPTHSPIVTRTAGSSSVALPLTARHPGRAAVFGGTWSNDQSLALTGMVVAFHHVDYLGSKAVPATPLTQTQFASMVSSLSLMVGNTVVGSAGPANLAADGSLEVSYNAALGNLVPLLAGASQPVGVRLTLHPNADQAMVNQFYVTLRSMSGRILVDSPVDRVIPFAASELPQTLVTVQPDFTPLEIWRIAFFKTPVGVATAANDADPDADGVPNLLEYMLGSDPLKPEPVLNAARGLTLLPVASPQSPVKFRLVLGNDAFSDTHVRLTVQSSTNCQTWTTLTTRNGGTWTALTPDFTIPGESGTTLLFTTASSPQAMPQRFLRLLAEELP